MTGSGQQKTPYLTVLYSKLGVIYQIQNKSMSYCKASLEKNLVVSDAVHFNVAPGP